MQKPVVKLVEHCPFTVLTGFVRPFISKIFATYFGVAPL